MEKLTVFLKNAKKRTGREPKPLRIGKLYFEYIKGTPFEGVLSPEKLSEALEEKGYIIRVNLPKRDERGRFGAHEPHYYKVKQIPWHILAEIANWGPKSSK